MPRVFIPPLLRSLCDGESELDVPGHTVRDVIGELDARYPGVRRRLCEGDALQPNLSVAVDGKISSLGLMEKVAPDSEVHFLPAVGGG